MTQRRRSIVEFEKWVDGELAKAVESLNGLEREVEEVRRRRAMEEVRLSTLREVKQRLAIEQVEEPPAEGLFADAEPEPVAAVS